jgi:hypothetical protein
MNTNEITDHDIRRALLGLGNANPDENFERRIFTEEIRDGSSEDGTFGERILASADELIDDFLAGILSFEERVRFEDGYLRSPEGRRRLAVASAFKNYLDSAKTTEAQPEPTHAPDVGPRSKWLPRLASTQIWALTQAALVLLAVAGVAWVYREKVDLEGRIDQMAADRAVMEEQVASLRQARAVTPNSVATAWLRPGLLRGPGEVERVAPPKDSDLIRFQLDVGIDDYRSYRAALHNAGGDEFWTQSKLGASDVNDTIVVTVAIPVELLPAGDYYYRLSGETTIGGLELVGRYHFRVLAE